MADLSDFKRVQIVTAHMEGASVTKTAELFGVARSPVSKVMTALFCPTHIYIYIYTLRKTTKPVT